MNFFKLYIGDYQRDTAHLSITEHGAYMLMLQHYYATEKPLPEGKALHRMLRAQDKAERDAIDSVAAQFWTATPDGLINARADKERAQAGAQAVVNARIARDREEKRKAARLEHDSCSDRTHETGTTESTNRSTNDQPNHSQTPDTREKQTPLPPAGGGGDRFAEFWQTWPSTARKVGKAACLERWKRRRLDEHADAILAEVARLKGSEQWQRGFEPAPLTYLNQRRWEDGDGQPGPDTPLYAVA